MQPEFIPGGQLSRAFYDEVVGPIVGDTLHAACLLGPGSDALDFDTAMSMDHDWGPRMQILLSESESVTEVQRRISEGLPHSFRGFAVFSSRNDDGTTRMDLDEGQLHRVEVIERNSFFERELGFDVGRETRVEDWLNVPQQKLLSVTGIFVFHDDIGLRELQSRFAFFPHDVWLYLLASLWQKVGQEEHLVGRAGLVGDEIGARIMVARLVRDLMRICFLLERKYIPYPKWFGTAFARLNCGPSTTSLAVIALEASDWQSRDHALTALYEHVAELQNAAKLCDPQPGKVGSFHDRPISVIHLHSPFAEALVRRITDPDVLNLAKEPLIGSRDIYSDSTDFLGG